MSFGRVFDFVIKLPIPVLEYFDNQKTTSTPASKIFSESGHGPFQCFKKHFHLIRVPEVPVI
jgi:hypothetical protein